MACDRSTNLERTRFNPIGTKRGGDHLSRNAFAIWSRSGLTRYEMTVRGSVWTNASTGMPGTSFRPPNLATSSGAMMIRTR